MLYYGDENHAAGIDMDRNYVTVTLCVDVPLFTVSESGAVLKTAIKRRNAMRRAMGCAHTQLTLGALE